MVGSGRRGERRMEREVNSEMERQRGREENGGKEIREKRVLARQSGWESGERRKGRGQSFRWTDWVGGVGRAREVRQTCIRTNAHAI